MTTCHVCGNALGDPVYHSHAEQSLTSLTQMHPGPALVYFCTHCGHVQTPEMKDAAAYYDTAYKILISSEEEDQIYEVVDGTQVYRTAHQVATLLAKVELPQNAKLLDYGCAKASTTRDLLQRRPDLAAHLFDVSEMYEQFWSRFVPKENWATYAPHPHWKNSFDLVTSYFAFEHIVDVRGAIAQVASLLKPGGAFYCIVPNIFGNTADFIVVDHVHHFTRTSLKALLAGGGLTVVDIDDKSHRGAFVVVARKTGTPAAPRSPAAEIGALGKEVAQMAAYWQTLGDKIRTFEAQHKAKAVSAIYGSGFYGAFIASSLGTTRHVRCFLDASPFQQGRQLFDIPVLAPPALPPEVNTLYVGLNPLHARRIIGEVAALKGRTLEILYL